jgi:hypothetical protein
MTETTKKTPRKAEPTPASTCMCKGDLLALVTATLMQRGSLPLNSAIETAKYIVEKSHEPA